MTNKSKGGGPKTDNGKAISSRNSITHGLTAKRWINDDEQSLFDTTVEALSKDFDPQTSIEKILISKLAECSVRLARIQRVEDAMFNLASSEASHPDLSIKSLSNNLDKNIPLEKIMLRGGWKSETSAMRYLKSWNDNNWLIIN